MRLTKPSPRAWSPITLAAVKACGKKATSGNTQRLVDMQFDCDADAILMLVEQTGPACHTNRPNCFYLRVEDGQVVVHA